MQYIFKAWEDTFMPKPIREKKHRFPQSLYCGYVAVAFTANVKNRNHLFIQSNIIRNFESIFLDELQNHSCSCYIYLFMPDHVHMIIAGESEHSNVKKCMDMFKQETGFWLYKNMNPNRWQKDYYDHIIRNEIDMNRHIRYILLNPVHAGLVDRWKEYPFKGSTKFNFDEWEEEL